MCVWVDHGKLFRTVINTQCLIITWFLIYSSIGLLHTSKQWKSSICKAAAASVLIRERHNLADRLVHTAFIWCTYFTIISKTVCRMKIHKWKRHIGSISFHNETGPNEVSLVLRPPHILSWRWWCRSQEFIIIWCDSHDKQYFPDQESYGKLNIMIKLLSR